MAAGGCCKRMLSTPAARYQKGATGRSQWRVLQTAKDVHRHMHTAVYYMICGVSVGSPFVTDFDTLRQALCVEVVLVPGG